MLRPAALALILLATPTFAAEPITGRATVIDGDTIEIAGTRIRIQGIDAPESWQRCWDAAGKSYRCGKVASEALDGFLAASRPTRCDPLNKDRYGRTVADCFRADGKSIGPYMVRTGNALDYRQYSKGAYAEDEAHAKAAKAGMWQGRFDAPWDARKQ